MKHPTSTSWLCALVLLVIYAPSISTYALELTPAAGSQSKTLTGIYELAIAETFDGKPPKYIHSLTAEKTRYELTGGDFFNDLKTGDTLAVSGTIKDYKLSVSSVIRLDTDNVNTRSVLSGDRRVAVIYLNFSDLDLLPNTIARVPRVMFTDEFHHYDDNFNPTDFSDSSVKAALELSSYGKVSLDTDPNNDGEFDTFGPYTIPFSKATCGAYQSWGDSGDLQATQDGADLSVYQHRLYIVPTHHCNWNGLAILSCGDSCRAWSRTSFEHTIAHELGHNFGLLHAAADLDGNGNIGASEDAADLGVMMSSGNQNLTGHLAHAPHRYALGWFDDVPGAITTVDQTGTYFLSDLDDTTSSQSKALYLDLDVPLGRRQIIVSYRRANFHPDGIGLDFFSPDPIVADSIRVHECIDTPCRRPKKLATLREGEVYLDESIGNDEFGLRIEARDVGEGLAEVNIFYGDTDNDGVDDYEDNCYAVFNPPQVDTDCDGYGNQCDADFNNDAIVNVIDLGVLQQQFFTSDELTDLNQDGVVNVSDLAVLRQLFFTAPGPAGPKATCAP